MDATYTTREGIMKGTAAQLQYAEDMLASISTWARETVAADVIEGDIPQYYAKIEAQRTVAEVSVIEAIIAGDLAAAEDLFAAVERADLVTGLLDGEELNAGRFIDTYKTLYYGKCR